MSTVRASTSKPLVVIYMLLAGMGAGQVRLMVQVGIVVNSYVLVQTLPTTTVAAQASVPRKDMSVVTAVRNVR